MFHRSCCSSSSVRMNFTVPSLRRTLPPFGSWLSKVKSRRVGRAHRFLSPPARGQVWCAKHTLITRRSAILARLARITSVSIYDFRFPIFDLRFSIPDWIGDIRQSKIANWGCHPPRIEYQDSAGWNFPFAAGYSAIIISKRPLVNAVLDQPK